MPRESQRERMLRGEYYDAADPDLVEARARAARLTHRYNATSAETHAERTTILEELLGSVGPGVEIRSPFHVDYGDNISIGARTFANFGLVALDCARITIGEDVQIAPNVQLLTATHPIEPEPRRQKLEYALPITVGNNVWLGGGAIVLPGVTIGENTVVGSGAVVTKDLPANVVAVGNPARVIRHLDETREA